MTQLWFFFELWVLVQSETSARPTAGLCCKRGNGE